MASHSVLFVCLGNICRSPMAEAIFRKLLADRNCVGQWEVDSAATAPWNLGNPPDPCAQQVMAVHGLSSEHKARLVQKEDFHTFEYILGFDEDNLQDLRHLAPVECRAVLKLLGHFDHEVPGEVVIKDPYYGEDRDFETVFEQCWKACNCFLDSTNTN